MTINSKEKCPLCDRDNLLLYIKKDNYPLLKCLICSFVFIPQKYYQKEDVANQYKRDEVSRTEYYLSSERYDFLHFNSNLDKLEKYIKPGLILDIGSNTGNFLAQAKKRGWIPVGIEPNLTAAQYIEARGFKVYKNYFTQEFVDSVNLKESFDAVHMSDVIEHVFSPLKMLELTFNILKIDGIVMITTHNVDSYFGQRYHLKPKEHISHFNLKSIAYALNKVGFKVLTCQKHSRIRDISNIEESTTKINNIESIIAKTIKILPFKLIINKIISYIIKDEILIIARK